MLRFKWTKLDAGIAAVFLGAVALLQAFENGSKHMVLDYVHNQQELEALSENIDHDPIIEWNEPNEYYTFTGGGWYDGVVTFIFDASGHRLSFENVRRGNPGFRLGYLRAFSIVDTGERYTKEKALDQFEYYLDFARSLDGWHDQGVDFIDERVLKSLDIINTRPEEGASPRDYLDALLENALINPQNNDMDFFEIGLIDGRYSLILGQNDITPSFSIEIQYDLKSPDRPFYFYLKTFSRSNCTDEMRWHFEDRLNGHISQIDPAVFASFEGWETDMITDEEVMPFIDDYILERCTLEEG